MEGPIKINKDFIATYKKGNALKETFLKWQDSTFT